MRDCVCANHGGGGNGVKERRKGKNTIQTNKQKHKYTKDPGIYIFHSRTTNTNKYKQPPTNQQQTINKQTDVGALRDTFPAYSQPNTPPTNTKHATQNKQTDVGTPTTNTKCNTKQTNKQMWERSDDQVYLEEERNRELEAMFEADVERDTRGMGGGMMMGKAAAASALVAGGGGEDGELGWWNWGGDAWRALALGTLSVTP
jgi:hypothetical protein